MDKNMFQRFPKIGDQIMSQLDLPTLLNCTLVCKDWNSFLDDPYFWLKKLKEVAQPTEIEADWRNLIEKSVQIGVGKQVFAKCLKRKFQHFVESQSKDDSAQEDAITWMKFPPLHTASLFGHIEIVKLIYHFELDFNRPINSKRYEGFLYFKDIEHYEMPIFAAIENGHTEIVKFLANTPRELQNPSINYKDQPLIYVAILHKNLDLVKFLVPRTQNLNKLYGTFGCVRYGLIHACVRGGDPNIMKYLVSMPDFDPNVRNDLRETALQELCRESFTSHLDVPQENILEMIRILAPLVDANNPMNFDKRKNPIHLALDSDSNEILKILVNHINANVKNQNGFLPIDVAVFRNKIEAIKILEPFTKELKILKFFQPPYSSKTESGVVLLKSLIEKRNRIGRKSRKKFS